MKRNTLTTFFATTCFILFASTFSACVSSKLEYDRMVSTAFPNEDTDSQGNTETLSTIYASGGHLLVVEEDQTNIAALTGPFNPFDPTQYDFITTAELQTLAIANRSVPIDADTTYNSAGKELRKYYVWGIVANHFRELDNGSRSTTTMGLMYDPLLRSAFVNYYKHPTNNSRNDLFLRSTAHEIGHAFNLSHGNGDGSTTIMNQTSDIDETTYIYEFSSTSLDHLQNHIRSAVYPGIGPRHYDVPHVH